MCQMETIVILLVLAAAVAAGPTPPQVVAGIPANYDESKVGEYVLPELLTSSDGDRSEERQRVGGKAPSGDTETT